MYEEYNYISDENELWTVLFDENNEVIKNEDGSIKTGYQYYLEWVESNKAPQLTTEEKIANITTEISEVKAVLNELEEQYYNILLEL